MCSRLAQTKIFISSVHEDGLKPLRHHAFKELAALGHEPLMWEQNLGPWPASVNPIVKCLEAVESADIFLMFVGNHSGTYDKAAQRTVTHMEFLKAFDRGKTILVFVDAGVKALFFSRAKWAIDEYTEHHLNESGRYPAPDSIVAALKLRDDLPDAVDPYVWFLLHDLAARNVYLDDLSLGVPIEWKTYLSDLLRRGALLLPLQHSIADHGSRLEQFDDTFRFLTDHIPRLRISIDGQGDALLASLQGMMPGGVIHHHYGKYMSEAVGAYGACSGATLYLADQDCMRRVAQCGDTASLPAIRMTDQRSYVVLANKLDTDLVHYTELKQMFYCSFKSGKYVLTLHFPAGPGWDNQKFMIYQDSVNRVIINKNPYLVEMIKLILGGLQS